jgi:DNA-binding transcriptional LysR family regulator
MRAVKCPNYNPYHLVVFYFVGSEKSVTSAAEKLCLTQPSVTHHIKCLEKAASVKLLDVKRKRVHLTNAGEGLFSYAAEVYHQLISAEKFLEDLKEARLHVGMAMNFSSTAASAASSFEKRCPRVKLIVKNAPSFEVAQDVLNSRVELGVVVSIDYAIPELRSIAISAGGKGAFVASPSNPIFRKEDIKLSDLCNCPLILGPETSAIRRLVFNKFEAEGLKLNNLVALVAAEVNTVELAMSLVENGKGIGFFYIRNIEKEVSEGRLRVIPLADDMRIGTDVLVRRDAVLSPIAKKFISLLRVAFQNGCRG